MLHCVINIDKTVISTVIAADAQCRDAATNHDYDGGILKFAMILNSVQYAKQHYSNSKAPCLSGGQCR